MVRHRHYEHPNYVHCEQWFHLGISPLLFFFRKIANVCEGDRETVRILKYQTNCCFIWFSFSLGVFYFYCCFSRIKSNGNNHIYVINWMRWLPSSTAAFCAQFAKTGISKTRRKHSPSRAYHAEHWTYSQDAHPSIESARGRESATYTDCCFWLRVSCCSRTY